MQAIAITLRPEFGGLFAGSPDGGADDINLVGQFFDGRPDGLPFANLFDIKPKVEHCARLRTKLSLTFNKDRTRGIAKNSR